MAMLNENVRVINAGRGRGTFFQEYLEFNVEVLSLGLIQAILIISDEKLGNPIRSRSIIFL